MNTPFFYMSIPIVEKAVWACSDN